MKRSLFLAGVLASVLVFGTEIAYAQTVSLDAAISGVADDFSYNLKRGSKVAILSMRVNSGRMSNYLIEEITSVLVNQRMVTVVDRAQLDLIQEEMNFQMSGEVSDSSAQAIGRKLGATSIITGSFEPLGDYYRFRVRVIEVETAAIIVTYSKNVHSDQVVASLMGGQSNVPVTAPQPPKASGSGTAQFSQGLNYSTGRKVGAGFLNMLIGLGSFTMGDWAGGLLVGGLELLGLSLAPIELELGNDIAVISLGIYLGGVITGFIQPFSYDKALAKKNGTYVGYEEGNPLYHISFIPTPTSTRNGTGMGVFYSTSY